MRAVLTSMRTALAVFVLWPCGAFAADSSAIAPELWDRPRTARSVLEQPAVRQAMRVYLQRENVRLVIHYPDGQEALLYAEELRSWLIALAVDGQSITLRPDRNRTAPLSIVATP